MASAGPTPGSPYLRWLLVRAFPGLRAWPVREWPTLLAQVKRLEFDQFERIGVIAGVGLVSWLLRPAATVELSVPFTYLSQLLFSLPLLLIVTGPFFLRRIRRGLDEAAKERRGPPSDALPQGD